MFCVRSQKFGRPASRRHVAAISFMNPFCQSVQTGPAAFGVADAVGMIVTPVMRV
jgi:hypothetical protein